MRPENSKGLALLPEKAPTEELLGEFKYDPELGKAVVLTNEPQRRAILWTAALQTFFVQEQIEKAIPGFRFATVGFADPETEEDAFGVLAYASHLVIHEEQKHIFKLDDHEFRLFVRPSFEVLHSLPQVHPADGTAACWARSNKAGRLHGKVGFLTAKHVAGAVVGRAVHTTHGQGRVLDLAPDSIDAALVEPPPIAAPPKLGKPLKSQKYIAQWTDVHFEGRGSGKRVDTKVSEVWFRDTYHPSLPARVILGWPGEPGDSGALVVDADDRGIGIYLGGQVNTATERMEGFCQHLGQAAGILECDLFK